ncbi:guanylate kinase [Candidatus Peregrinibacteria bacterium]|nr:guanylate kinase [Candidatus Peregrinibacteria bacterium]
MKGKLFLLLGPSGCGKSSVKELLRQRHPDFMYPVSATTRAKRPGEKEGETYHYLTRKQFETKIKKGELLEHELVHETNYYGIPKQPVMEGLEAGKTIVREVDIRGYEEVRKHIPVKNLISVFITVPNQQELIDRIINRGPMTKEELKHRIVSMRMELAKARECDYLVENKAGELEKTVEKVEKIIETESAPKTRRKKSR